MLVHVSGINRGDIPVRLYHVEENSGCVLVGSESARIMLTPEEIRDLHKLLEPFARNTEREGPGRVVIPEPQQGLLLRMPTHTPVLLGLDPSWKETALVIRVEDLEPFRVPELPIQVGFCLYRSGAGTWIVCVPFRVYDKQDDPLEGDAYLNPRQQADYALLENLARQELFPFAFLAWNLKDAVTKAIPWRQQEEAAKALDAVDVSLSGKLSGSFDPDFELAKMEFQKNFSVRDLLPGK